MYKEDTRSNQKTCQASLEAKAIDGPVKGVSQGGGAGMPPQVTRFW